MPAGGYQAPANPAPVSGPGPMSQRTDGGPVMELPDAQYGEAKRFREIQQGAPMAESQGSPAGPRPQVTPLDAPSGRPGEPVTAGADLGPGPTSASLGTDYGSMRDREMQATAAAWLPMLEQYATDPDTPQSVRNLVRYLRGSA